MKIAVWGEKIGLRALEDWLSDAEIERVHRWSRDPEILRMSGGAPTELALAEFRERIRGESKNPPSDRKTFFIVTHTGEMIGRIGCFALDDEMKEGELGIVIGERAYWGKGYGRDTIATLLRHLFGTTPLERINLFTYPENLRAQQCFAACGFRSLATAKRFSPDLGEFEGLEMTLTRREFLAQANLASQIPISQELFIRSTAHQQANEN